MTTRPTASSLSLLLACAATSAAAQPMPMPPMPPMPPAPQHVVSLTATATTEVVKDWLSIHFSTTREGLDAAAVQSQLRQALDVALAEARKIAKPGQVEVQTGGFSLYPRYAPKGGGINGWQGSTELIVQGRDTPAISQLTGRVQTLSIARVGFSLSREAREKVEADVAAEAIVRFRSRADAVSRQFGFTGYAVREVTVATEGGQTLPQPVMRMQATRAADANESLPVEAGKALVTATVSGSVQMK
ncbi:MAG: SIMPL domain-containing protein [Rubrivivax sp.]|nr:SIMPL domain-containing protein [Rubrivivax sp.]